MSGPVDILDLIADAKLSFDEPLTGEMVESGRPESCVARLRSTHHLLARVIAEGKSNEAASALTGYSPGRITMLRADPAFNELVQYYHAQVEDLFANIQDRIAALGVAALDELQERLEASPESFSITQLQKLSESLLDRSIAPAKGAAKGGVGPTAVSVKINFVGQSDTNLLDLSPV